MTKFYVGQPVVINREADNAVGCAGRILSVSEDTCDVWVNAPSGSFVGAFAKELLEAGDDC